MSELAAQTYDAVWALALALRNAQRAWLGATNSQASPRLHHFHYGRADMAREILRQVALLNFTGVSVSRVAARRVAAPLPV